MALLLLQKGWVGAVGQLQMCHLCSVKEFQIFCAVGKKLKHEAVGCRVGKKSARWSVFSPVFLMSFGQV